MSTVALRQMLDVIALKLCEKKLPEAIERTEAFLEVLENMQIAAEKLSTVKVTAIPNASIVPKLTYRSSDIIRVRSLTSIARQVIEKSGPYFTVIKGSGLPGTPEKKWFIRTALTPGIRKKQQISEEWIKEVDDPNFVVIEVCPIGTPFNPKKD